MNFLLKHCKHVELVLRILKSSPSPRLVGGCVRDSILQISNYDIDIATPLPPEEVLFLCSKNKIKAIPTGAKFGTITVFIECEKFEITTLREDIKCYGRYADVKFTNDFFLDASRRDFTINALSYCCTENKIYDYYNGIDHLKERKVLFIGDARQRIEEDHLRILRFFRFSSKYANLLDVECYVQCCELRYLLKKISAERILSELHKLIVSTNAVEVLSKMIEGKICFVINEKIFWDVALLEKAITVVKTFDIELTTDIRFAFLFYRNSVNNLQAELRVLRFSNRSIESILMMVYFIQNTNKYTYFDKLKKQWYDNFSLVNQYIVIGITLGYIDLIQAMNLMVEMKHEALRLPVNGQDLINLGYKNEEIGKKLQLLKGLWLTNSYGASKFELLDMISKL